MLPALPITARPAQMDEEDFKDDIYLRSRWCGLLHPNTGISQVATATITTTTDAPT